MKETSEEREILNHYRSLNDNAKELFKLILHQLHLIKDDIAIGKLTHDSTTITINHCTINGSDNNFVSGYRFTQRKD